jgi:hypothetical protein
MDNELCACGWSLWHPSSFFLSFCKLHTHYSCCRKVKVGEDEWNM